MATSARSAYERGEGVVSGSSHWSPRSARESCPGRSASGRLLARSAYGWCGDAERRHQGNLPLAGVHRILLATRDAHELYRRYGGFSNLSAPDRSMELIRK